MDINAINADAMELLARITRAQIQRCHAPLIGDYLTVLRKGEEPSLPNGIESAYEAPTITGIINRIYIGSKWHGPVLMWSEEGWMNIFSHGNYGKNITHGGTWSGCVKRRHATIAEAIANRDADADAALCGKKVRMTESADFRALLASVREG